MSGEHDQLGPFEGRSDDVSPAGGEEPVKERRLRPFESFHRNLAPLGDDDACRELDEEMAAMVNAGTVKPLPGPDKPRNKYRSWFKSVATRFLRWRE